MFIFVLKKWIWCGQLETDHFDIDNSIVFFFRGPPLARIRALSISAWASMLTDPREGWRVSNYFKMAAKRRGLRVKVGRKDTVKLDYSPLWIPSCNTLMLMDVATSFWTLNQVSWFESTNWGGKSDVQDH